MLKRVGNQWLSLPRYLTEGKKETGVEWREEPRMKFFTVKVRDVVVFLSGEGYYGVCKCNILKVEDVTWCKNRVREKILCIGVIGGSESRWVERGLGKKVRTPESLRPRKVCRCAMGFVQGQLWGFC